MKAHINVISQAIIKQTKIKQSKAKLAETIAAYLLEEKRTGDLYSILRTIQQDFADNGYVEASVTSAYPLTDQAKADVENILKKSYPDAKTIKLNAKLDEATIGGVVLNTANDQLDLSIASKLGKFKQLTALK